MHALLMVEKAVSRKPLLGLRFIQPAGEGRAAVFTCPLEWIPQPAASDAELQAAVPSCLMSTLETFLT